jgi:serine/threonine protein kinase
MNNESKAYNVNTLTNNANIVDLQSLGSHGICQLSTCLNKDKNLIMFRKTYYEIDKSIAYNEMFINERITALNNNSNNITEYYGSYNNEKGELNLLFENSELGSLIDYINTAENKFLDNIMILKQYLIQIIDALIIIHKQGVIHNDLKLENILLFKNKKGNYFPKICDFNNSLFVDSNGEIINLFSQYNDYHCPFPFPFESPSFEFDFWCLGVIIFQMIFKKFPFNFFSGYRNFINQVEDKTYKTTDFYKNFLQNYSNYSYIIDDLLDNLLDLNPDKRLKDKNILKHSFFSTNKIKTIRFKNNKKINYYKKKYFKLLTMTENGVTNSKRNKLKNRLVKCIKMIYKYGNTSLS